MKKRRIFVAYRLSENLQQTIERWSAGYQTLPVRWTPPKNLHVTFVPPWYAEDVDEVVSLLESTTYPVSNIPISFESISLGPEYKRPWILWAKGMMPKSFLTLRTYLLNLLHRTDEKRKPILHTTLARLNKKQFEEFPDKQFSDSIKWEDTITSFSLIESHLHRTGVVYETISDILL